MNHESNEGENGLGMNDGIAIVSGMPIGLKNTMIKSSYSRMMNRDLSQDKDYLVMPLQKIPSLFLSRPYSCMIFLNKSWRIMEHNSPVFQERTVNILNRMNFNNSYEEVISSISKAERNTHRVMGKLNGLFLP